MAKYAGVLRSSGLLLRQAQHSLTLVSSGGPPTDVYSSDPGLRSSVMNAHHLRFLTRVTLDSADQNVEGKLNAQNRRRVGARPDDGGFGVVKLAHLEPRFRIAEWGA